MFLPPYFHKALHFVVPSGFRPTRYLKESVIDGQKTHCKGDGYDKERRYSGDKSNTADE